MRVILAASRFALVGIIALVLMGGAVFAQDNGDKTWDDAMALFDGGLDAYGEGRLWDAVTLYEQALVIMQGLEDPFAEANIMMNLGFAYFKLGQYENALAAHESARAIFVENQMLIDVAIADFMIGLLYHLLSRYQDALSSYDSARAIFVENEMVVDVAEIDQSIGSVYRNLGRYEEGLEKYESARSVFLANDMTVKVATIDQSIGSIYCELGRYENALALYNSARAIFVENEMIVDVAEIDQSIGGVYCELGRYKDALEAFRFARAIYVENEMAVAVAGIDQNIGVVYCELGRYENALALYNSARAIFVENEMIVKVATIDQSIGSIYCELGRYENALALYNSARAIFVENKMVLDVAGIDQNIGAVYAELGRYKDALEAFRFARAVFLENDITVKVATIDQNIGVVYRELGRYENALALYNSARAIFVENEMVLDVAGIEQNIGAVYQELGRYEEALALYESARAIFVENKMVLDVAEIDQNIGGIYWRLGQYEEALSRYESMRTVYAENEMVVAVAEADKIIGNYFLEFGGYEEALAAYESARAIFVENEMIVAVAGIDQNIGIVYRELGQYEEALAAYESALSGISAVVAAEGMLFSYPSERWRIYSGMGVAYEGLGDREKALTSYKNSIAVIESIRGNLTSEDLKQAWQEETQYVYDRLIDLLYRMGEGTSAFTYAERCRARTFLDALYQGGITADQLISPEEGISSGAVDPEVVVQAVDDAQDMLLPNETVLEYMVTDTGVYLWIVTADGIAEPDFLEYPRDQLMNDILALRQAIEGSGPDPITTTEFLEAFYEKLVQKSLETLPNGVDTLIIIPSGPLWYLPFSALMMTDQPEIEVEGIGFASMYRPTYLVEQYTLAYLPSLASMPSLVKEEDPAATSLLALADPERSLVPVYESRESPCGDDEGLGRYEELVDACHAFADQLFAGEGEATQRVYAGEEAHEALAYQVSEQQVVLYAAHGQFNAYAPLQSKLLLAPSEETENAGSDRRSLDGDYHAWEVLLTDYRGTDLVILAACETLLPHLNDVKGTMAVMSNQTCDEVVLTPHQLEKIVVGDEVVGLARAFLSSGAEAVVGTLWLANPYAIEELLVSMAKYYKQGATWAQALIRAQRDLIAIPSFDEVWFWAPYQLIGRWR